MSLTKILRNPLTPALLYSTALLFAVYGKLFHPSKYLERLDRWTSGVELALIIALLIFRGHFLMWLVVSLVSALFGGYAFFWNQLHLPCDCLGTLIKIPTWASLIFDGLFFVVGLWMAYRLGARRKLLVLTLLLSVIVSVCGFIFAKSIYDGI